MHVSSLNVFIIMVISHVHCFMPTFIQNEENILHSFIQLKFLTPASPILFFLLLVALSHVKM